MVFGGPMFLDVFLKTLFDNFGAKMGQNHSVGQARERQTNTKKVAWLPRWCSWRLRGASRRVFRRFRVKFGMDSLCFFLKNLGYFFSIKSF